MKRILVLICLWLTGYTAMAQCNAAFTTTATGQQVSFSPVATVAGLRHTWMFGDGTSSSAVSPVHIYSQAGSFQVVHAVYDSTNQCRDSSMVSLQVGGGIPCTASISYVRDSGAFNR